PAIGCRELALCPGVVKRHAPVVEKVGVARQQPIGREITQLQRLLAQRLALARTDRPRESLKPGRRFMKDTLRRQRHILYSPPPESGSLSSFAFGSTHRTSISRVSSSSNSLRNCTSRM